MRMQDFLKIGNIINEITEEAFALCVIKSTQTQSKYTYYPYMMELVVYINQLFPGVVRYLTTKQVGIINILILTLFFDLYFSTKSAILPSMHSKLYRTYLKYIMTIFIISALPT